MSAAVPGEPLALDFKSATLYAVRALLHSHDTAALVAALDKRMAEAGSFFENEPVVIDAARLEAAPDWPALVAALRERNLPPIGVVASGAVLESAVAAGLTPVELSAPPVRPAPSAAAATAAAAAAPMPSTQSAEPLTGTAQAPADAAGPAQPAEAHHPDAPATNGQAQAHASNGARPADPPPAATPALVINRPLRSGQRVYARNTDLIVIGMVSPGAEVIADGNIHVYGPLRGKAMAGARGDASARIFTTQLDAELLAIAGIYRVVEDKLPESVHNRPAQVRLDNDRLCLDPLQN